jgi:surfeit locus 1 family protein
VKPRIIAFLVLSGALSALFVRLGTWQLDRRLERRAQNDSTRAALTFGTVAGTPDWDNEFVVTGRSRNGSPGVHIYTPVRRSGDSGAVTLVNRGWVYAADAATADLTRWREPTTSFTGYVQTIPRGPTLNAKGRGLRPLVRDGVQKLVPYPVDTQYVVAQNTVAGDATPIRLDLPDLTEGPHFSYAIQWFCFAAIALGGAIVVFLRSRRPETPAQPLPQG